MGSIRHFINFSASPEIVKRYWNFHFLGSRDRASISSGNLILFDDFEQNPAFWLKASINYWFYKHFRMRIARRAKPALANAFSRFLRELNFTNPHLGLPPNPSSFILHPSSFILHPMKDEGWRMKDEGWRIRKGEQVAGPQTASGSALPDHCTRFCPGSHFYSGGWGSERRPRAQEKSQPSQIVHYQHIKWAESMWDKFNCGLVVFRSFRSW